MQKVKLTPEQSAFIKMQSHTVYFGETWHYMPFWHKETEDPDVFEVHTLGELPPGLSQELDKHRTTEP